MNRYANIEKLRNENEYVGTLGTQYYKDVTYPEVLPNENDIWVELFKRFYSFFWCF